MRKQPEKSESLESWTWDAACSILGAMACMNKIIHGMEGEIETGDTFKKPKFRDPRSKFRTFDRVVATARRDSESKPAKPGCRASHREDNPMWNQDWFTETAVNMERFPDSATHGWIFHLC